MKVMQRVTKFSLAASLVLTTGATSVFSASRSALCPNISAREIRDYYRYGDSVLIAETSPIGAPVKKGSGEWGRGFSGSISTTFAVRPLKFFKNDGRLPNSVFTVVDVEDYGADGGFQGGGLLPDSKAVSLIAVTKSKDNPAGREIFASERCVTPEDAQH